jgi:CDP-diacylglycerol--glycerol-3-phosphate 3-phosphatidyltransferase
VPLALAGMLSDILDGVVARRLGVARPWLRRLDSLADVTFYLCVLGATWVVAGPVVEAGWLPLGLLLLSEVGCLTASLLRFGVLPATHCYSAKAYGLVLFFAFVGVLSFGAGVWAFYALAAVGLIDNAEVLSILLLSQTPPVDVPSVFKLFPGRASSVA